jgi:hypothetical protein
MSWFSKLKAVFGLARKIPKVDDAIDEIEDKGKEFLQNAGPIGDVVLELVGEKHTPGQFCIECGEYQAIRDGEPVINWQGAFDRVTLDAGDRFPPVIERGDVWQRLG